MRHGGPAVIQAKSYCNPSWVVAVAVCVFAFSAKCDAGVIFPESLVNLGNARDSNSPTGLESESLPMETESDGTSSDDNSSRGSPSSDLPDVSKSPLEALFANDCGGTSAPRTPQAQQSGGVAIVADKADLLADECAFNQWQERRVQLPPGPNDRLLDPPR